MILLPVALMCSAMYGNPAEGRRRVTVRDAIQMTVLSDEHYFLGGSSEGRVAQFSSDGKWFSIVLERGELEPDAIAYSLLVFKTSQAFDSPKPKVLAALRSTTGQPAIKDPKWLSDNRTLLFLCEEKGRVSQICSLDRVTGKLTPITRHQTPILSFAASRDGGVLAFLAAAPKHKEVAKVGDEGIIITAETPDAIPRDNCSCRIAPAEEGDDFYIQTRNGLERKVNVQDFLSAYLPILISPDGRYAAIGAAVTNIPEGWENYTDPLVRRYASERRSPGSHSFLMRYLLVDTASEEIRPLIDAPLSSVGAGIVWSQDSKSVMVSGTFLPLDAEDSQEQSKRQASSFVVEVSIPTRALSIIAETTGHPLQVTKWLPAENEIILRAPLEPDSAPVAFQKAGGSWKEIPLVSKGEIRDAPVRVSLEEDINTPPDIYVSDYGHRHKLLLELNPQLRDIDLGRAQRVTWSATDGHEVMGTLFLPPQFKPGVKYPLVIQTHGGESHRFEMDGPWHSAFAARMLTAQDIIVLEIGHAKNPGEDLRYFNSPEEAPREMAAYEGAIDYLADKGLIDRSRVGILGFSRTVWKVEFTLTHSKYLFAAALLADGFDAGYFQYLLYRGSDSDYVRVNGDRPFGPGLEHWLAVAPGFRLDRVRTPVRLESHGFYHTLGNWEWFSGLTHLNRPVELVDLPGAPHLLVKPSDRIASQQGTVDWFSFWLKDEESSDPAKAEQNRRWTEMRKLQQTNK